MSDKVIPIYVKRGTPGAENIAAEERMWEDVCRKDCVWISRHTFRPIGRWGGAERKRTFEVAVWARTKRSFPHTHTVGWYSTIEAAYKAALKYLAGE